MNESGYPGFDAAIWYSIVGPKGLPPEVMAKLVPAFNEVMKDPTIVKSVNADGYDVMEMTPAQMNDFVKKDLKRWGEIIQKAGVKDE